MAQVSSSNCEAETARVEVDAGGDVTIADGPRLGVGDGGELNELLVLGLGLI